jgi:putative transposase
MPRATRFYLPGTTWHITHRCHDRKFLLKFERDRLRWKHWLFQAKHRYGLSVLNYIATNIHVHILVKDSRHCEIAKSMQLISGRTAQEYNRRKSRKGAFWEDRYFATAVSTDRHLIRCLLYIDLNMVRAGVVDHPSLW